jgi:hypothetical protein
METGNCTYANDPVFGIFQCSGFVTFLHGYGCPDPLLWITDPDPGSGLFFEQDPDTGLFFTSFQVDEKKKKFSVLFLLITYLRLHLSSKITSHQDVTKSVLWIRMFWASRVRIRHYL